MILPLQSETAKAINYFLRRWQTLIYYCDDGVVQIDDNIVEDALRTVSQGGIHGRDAPLTAIAFEVTIKHASTTKVLATAVRYRTDIIGAEHELRFFSKGYSPAAEPLTMDEQCH